MNKQEIFTECLTKMRAQGAPAMEGGSCFYRIGGKGCAIGVLLSDEEVNALGDNNGATVGKLAKHKLLPERLVGDNEFLSRLQLCHDGASSWSNFIEEFERRMKRVAKDYGLEYV